MAEAVLGLVLSPFLQVFFERMTSHEFDGFFRERKLKDRLLRKLKTSLLAVNAVLEDAEDRQFTETSVKEWLDELKDAVYDAEDILNEIATKDLQRKLDSEFGTNASKVRHFISDPLFVKKIQVKIKDALDRLEDLAEQIGVLGLRAGVGGKPLERLPTTSLIEESNICGRNYDKEAIINSLLSDDARGSEIGVIAIVGMGGIGKTTLAQLVYNDTRVKEHFDLKVWVCVSDPYDVFIVMKTILEAITPSPCDIKDLNQLQIQLSCIKDLNQLQIKLNEMLTGKKFLLVLDDVWDTTYAKWEVLSNAFKSGAQGSKVIVTTRDSEVARVMGAGATRPIMELSKEDCWSLFAKYAFHDGNSNAYPELEVIGKQIVENCKGLPLAIKAIGALLRSKLDVDEWDKVLRSELWDLSIEETGILPALGLSYKYLSPNQKRCFAYCSIFPKDYAFKKDKLILLWMAEGFLPQPKNKTMEEVGDDYFLALVSRSLFQRSNHNEYKMHDLVIDLAKFISKQFTLSHEDDSSREIGSNTRHFSYYSKKIPVVKFETFNEVKRLRTIVELNLFTDDVFYLSETQFLLPMIRNLRVLILSHRGNTSLPDSIGKLINLRYLDLSCTWIKRLPDSLCKLCNLQILNLSHCRDLVALPRDMHKLINLQRLNLSNCWDLAALPIDVHKLINLRHLDIDETKIMEMPINLGKLKCLQTLTKFMVGKHSGSCIGELGKLTNLRGSLSILELQNVESPNDAKNVNLRDKKYLEKLVLKWIVDTNASESHIIVLDGLQPHSSLKSLTINGYGGKSFPNWVGYPSFSNVASLHLRNCNHCCSLPPLGQLPSLQVLSIVGLDGVVIVGREFYGSGSSSTKPFGVLKDLKFENMLKWEEWFSFDTENTGGAFPQLKKLYIKDCPKLTGVLPVHLPCLVKLNIHECPQLVASLPRASSQCKMMVENCNTVVLFNESPTGIQELEIRQFDAVELTIRSCMKLELPMHLGFSSLEYLMLDGCDYLKSFPLDLFPNLRRLEIWGCGNLESLTVQEQHEHDLLLSLIDINGCPNFVYFPKGGLHAPSLKEFCITNCGSLPSLPNNMHILLSSLKKLYIQDCPEVESFPEGGLPSNLNEIHIENCEKLFASWMGWGLQKLPSVRIFKIRSKSEDVVSFPEVGLLPTSLTYLCIKCFPNLKYLDNKGLQHLTALEKLEIGSCPKLKCMPEDGLPASLSTLNIFFCPLLKKEYQKKEGKEWRKIAHIQHKWIE
jgi:Leucine-rich repeat (LRR) protein